MEKHQHNAYQQILYTDLNRISSLTDRRIFDYILHRMLFAAGTSPNVKIANGSSAYFPDGSALVEYVSGDRGTGVTFKINAGLGLKKFSSGQPDADSPAFLPIFVDADDSFVTNGSDATDPRIDRVFMKPVYADENQQTVNVIDPDPPNNITAESRYINEAYRYDFQYVAGTPAASPVPPDPPSGYTANDAIADILIQPGSGAFNPDDLSDLRTLFELDDQLVPAVTSLPAGSIVVNPTVLGEDNAQDALEALETAVAGVAPVGLLVGQLKYVNTQSVKLDRVMGSDIRVEIDGEVLTSSSAITWDITSHLEGGQSESASTPYYLYLYDSSGTLLQKISETAPVLNPVNKMGYHPTNTGWRCVGFVINDASSNFIPFVMDGRDMRVKKYNSDLHWDLNTTTPLVWTTVSLTIVPEGAMTVEFGHALQADDAGVAFGTSDASFPLPSGYGPWWMHSSGLQDAIFLRIAFPDDDGARSGSAQFRMPMIDPSTPAIKYGNVQENSSNSIDGSELWITGIWFPFAPPY